MMPSNNLSLVPKVGNFLSPDHINSTPLYDYELGGIGLNDPSQGLQVQTWHCRKVNDDILIGSSTVAETIQFNKPNITELSFTFDQNMNPFVTFVQDDGIPANRLVTYWWWDSLSSSQIFTALPITTLQPRCCMDDKRIMQTDIGTNDIILAYVTPAFVLHTRMQRDRFLVEYTPLNQQEVAKQQAVIERIGMNDVNRLQFLMRSTIGKDC